MVNGEMSDQYVEGKFNNEPELIDAFIKTSL